MTDRQKFEILFHPMRLEGGESREEVAGDKPRLIKDGVAHEISEEEALNQLMSAGLLSQADVLRVMREKEEYYAKKAKGEV